MWTTTRFPSAMRSLNPTTRAKAIEIANELLATGHTNRQEAILLGIGQARTWMRRQTADTGLCTLACQLGTI